MAKSNVAKSLPFDTEKFRAGMRQGEEAMRRFVEACADLHKPAA